MIDKDTKLCINCRWYKRSNIGPFHSECKHISAERKNRVNGAVERGYCHLERTLGACGEDGLFFEKAEPRENKQTSSNGIIRKILMLLGIK